MRQFKWISFCGGERGTMMGLFAATRNVLGVPSPTIGGHLWYNYEPRTPFYVYAFSSMIMFLILLSLSRKPDRERRIVSIFESGLSSTVWATRLSFLKSNP